MKSATEELMHNLEILYENIFNLIQAQNLSASSTSAADIKVTLKNLDGTSNVITFGSFQKIQQELNRLSSNFQSLTNSDNLSYTLNSDGSLSQYTKTSFMNAEVLKNFNFNGEQCIVDNVSIVNDLLFPNVKLPITIDSTIKTDILCTVYEIINGWDLIPTNPTILDIAYLHKTGKIQYKEVKRELSINKEQVSYFGSFNIETISFDAVNANIVTVTLDKLQYQSIATIGNAVELKTGDYLVSTSGASKYQITFIDQVLRNVTMTRVAGSEIIKIGIGALLYNQVLSNPETNIVNVPIKPAQKIVVFLSTENIKAISYPSVGIKIDTAEFKVVYQNVVYTVDEFFSNFVTDFSTYLTTLMSETSIPYSLGIKPSAPVLDANNFRVIQTNRHLTDSKTIAEISTLNKKKQSIQDQIDYKETQILSIQKTIDAQKYGSSSEKKNLTTSIITLRQDINTLKTNILTIARDIDNAANVAGIKSIDAKYKLIGFWPVQEPIYSSATQLQHIIKYDIQYRYLSKDTDKTDSTTYTMVTNGKELSVVFSNWQDSSSKTLSKTIDDNGNIVWEIPVLDSANDININQLAIPLQEGESIEIQVRAVSEAGYPIAPVKSDWSSILRYDFPNDLKNTSINATINQNNNDLQNAMFNDILNKAGVLTHVANTLKEGDKTFLHSASDITSGQYTAEQKNIPLDVFNVSLLNRIAALESSKKSNTVEISVIDFNNELYTIANNSTIDIFAGNYSDVIPVLDNTKWGGIIRQKGYIKIRNNNNTPVELKSLSPGLNSVDDGINPPVWNFKQTSAPQYFNVPIKNTDKLLQETRQLLYFRNVDLSNQQNIDAYKLVVSKVPNYPNVTTIPTDIVILAPIDSLQNIVYCNTTPETAITDDIKTCQLTTPYTTNFVAFTKEHPMWVGSNGTPDKAGLITEFKRIEQYTSILKTKQYQTEISDLSGLKGIVGFDENDKYAVGATTCGAFLYPVFSSKSAISVAGFNASSTLIIPAVTEILIPFIFEYRMIDRLGNIDGLPTANSNNTLEYSKKLGIDILINNDVFKFDINVYARLKAKINGIDAKNVNSLLASFTDENQSNLV